LFAINGGAIVVDRWLHPAQWDVYNNDTPRWKMEASVPLDRKGDDNGVPDYEFADAGHTVRLGRPRI
jgi:hypothetical protein